MRKWSVAAVLAAVSASAFAQDAKKVQGEEKAAVEKRSFPFEGEVAVDRLNVRMFPKADQTSIITSVLGQGEKVTVVGEKEDFYQILPPRGSSAWVSARNVKKEGNVGAVAANDVPVRMDSRVGADTLCTLKEGEQVKILAEHMGWFKIEAPSAVKYYVGKKYVKAGAAVAAAGRGAEVHAHFNKDDRKKAAEPRAAESGFRVKVNVAEALLDEQKKLIDAQRLAEVDFGGVLSAWEAALAAAGTDAERAEARKGVSRYRELEVVWKTYQIRLAAAEEDARKKQKDMLEKQPEAQPKTWKMTGYVDTCGLLWKRPGTHKLVMGGKIVAFLRVKEGDEKMLARFNDLYEKYVGVNGVVIKNPEGWDGYSVIVVEEITAIEKQ